MFFTSQEKQLCTYASCAVLQILFMLHQRHCFILLDAHMPQSFTHLLTMPVWWYQRLPNKPQ